MKTVTITIPLVEAERLLNKLPVTQYPRTLLALAGKKELGPLITDPALSFPASFNSAEEVQ